MTDAIHHPTSRLGMIKLLAIKDLQIYQKPLAGFVVGMILALGLIGTGKSWPFAAGSLLLLVLLVTISSFSIQATLIGERKEQTLPFIMSLPVSPMDYYWGKLLGTLAIYLVPFTLVAVGSVGLVLATPLPDGLLVFFVLVLSFLLMCFCVHLCVAIAVTSEAWIVFTMMALMTLVGPYIYGLVRFTSIRAHLNTNTIAWDGTTLGLLGAQVAVIAIVLGVTSWAHARKTSFL